MEGYYQPIEKYKSKSPIETELKELKHRFENTYNIIGNIVFRVNHAAVRKGGFTGQVLLPFRPPLLVCLSDEGGWNPL